MISALLYSNAPCLGPRVNRRHYLRARVRGSDGNDIVRIGGVSVKGNEEIPLDDSVSIVQVEHVAAGETPISVEIF